MSIFRNVYQMPPIDWWGKALSLETAFGLCACDVKDEVDNAVYSIEKEYPHTIMCGVVGDPAGCNFEVVVYAKVENNGTVYAFTNAELLSENITKIHYKEDLF